MGEFMDLKKYRWVFWATCFLLPLTVSNDSLWIDEANTWLYASLPGIPALLHHLATDHQADCQMPLSMVLAFIFEKILGDGEWAMRAPNLIWGGLSLGLLYQVGKKLRLPWLVLFFALQPYWWFYMDEARPYALQILGGCWLFFAVVKFFTEDDLLKTHWHLAGASILLCYSTMLAPATLAALALVLILGPENRPRLFQKRFCTPWGVAFVLNAPIGFFYLTTLLRGAGGTKIWAVDLKIPPYWLYEISGVFGLGPATAELRTLSRGSLGGILENVWLPLCFLLFYGIVWLAGLGCLKDKNQRRLFHASIGVVGITCLCFLGAAFLLEKAFWARHFAPLFAFILALFYLPLAAVTEKSSWGRWAALVIWSGLTMASFQVRFQETHAHDNYREAARIAKEESARGRVVYWVANRESADYYQVPFEPDSPSKIYDLGTGVKFSTEAPLKDISVLYSKPDIFDPSSVVADYLKKNGFTEKTHLSAFKIYEFP